MPLVSSFQSILRTVIVGSESSATVGSCGAATGNSRSNCRFSLTARPPERIW